MYAVSDDSEGFSGRALARAAGVVPQTRDTWVDRGLLTRKERYFLADLLELIALKTVLRYLAKGDAADAWEQIQPDIGAIKTVDTAVIWDGERGQARIVSGPEAIAEAVLHGRPVQAMAIGAELAEARAAFGRGRKGKK
jgi:hypothetical protein